jgi:putative ABC transport system ATP-binding protein
MPESIIAVRGISKSVQDASGQLDILRDIDFSLIAGETAAIVGASGSGKSTLLAILAGLDTPSTGQVVLAGPNMWDLCFRAFSSCPI